jgi:hypothetical protein
VSSTLAEKGGLMVVSRLKATTGVVLLVGCLCQLWIGPALAQDADSCARKSLAAIASGYAAVQSLYLRCSVKSLSIASPPNCESGVDDEKLVAVGNKVFQKTSKACPAPSGGTVACASIAANQSADVVEGTFSFGVMPEPDSALRACRAAIGSESAKLSKKAMAALKKCNQKALAGELGYGPVGPTCTDTVGTPQADIAAAELKLRDKLAAKCGGDDGMLGTVDDLDPQDDLGFGATCNGLPHCLDPIPELTDLADCAVCLATRQVEQAITGAAALPLSAAANCSVSLGREYSRLADRELDDLATCEDRVIRGFETPPCPDATTVDRIANDEESARVAASEDCALLDPQDDLGFGAVCPNVGLCGAVDVSDTDGLLECLRCVTADRTSLVVANLFPVSAEETDSAREDCRREIGARFAASGTSLGQRKLSRLRTCEATVGCGQITGPCPDSETLPAIDDARASAVAGITAECTGIDPQDLGFGLVCPSVYSCGGQETDSLAGLITCLTCITDGAVDELIALDFSGP